MRMIDDLRDQPVQKLWLCLTAEEATMVIEALQRGADEGDSDWHTHIQSADGRDIELTLMLYDVDDLSPDIERPMAEFLRTGEWGDSTL
jgi:hypothetical protein